MDRALHGKISGGDPYGYDIVRAAGEHYINLGDARIVPRSLEKVGLEKFADGHNPRL
ncbi:MAG: hypothetical protein WB611_03535 [Stellaceae bacterium]